MPVEVPALFISWKELRVGGNSARLAVPSSSSSDFAKAASPLHG